MDVLSGAALHLAVFNNDLAELTSLLSQGANVNSRDSNFKTPLHVAAEKNHHYSHFETIEALLRFGADVNAQDVCGNRPLHCFEWNTNVETIQLLLDSGADVNATDSKGQTPLYDAIFSGNVDLIRALLEHGADVNCTSGHQRLTPTHWACKHNSGCEVFKLLVRHGADFNLRDCRGRSALVYALQESKPKVTVKKLRLLLKYTDLRNGNLSFSGSASNLDKIIVRHLARLRSQEVPVILPQIMRKYFKECLDELDEAKRVKLKNSWVSFYSLLVGNKRKLKNYAGNLDLVKRFKRKDCKDRFSLYGTDMWENFKKGVTRRKLFDECTVVLSGAMPVFNPDHLVVRAILDCLGSSDYVYLTERV